MINFCQLKEGLPPVSSTLRADATTCQLIFTHTTGEGRQMKATDFHLVGSGPTASQSSYNWLATM